MISLNSAGLDSHIRNGHLIAKHYNEIDAAAFTARWPNFRPWEFDSDDFSVRLHLGSMDALQAMRAELGRPMRITSAYRNPSHNRRVGGSRVSQHLKGWAYDIVLPRKGDGPRLEALAKKHGFTAVGRYPARRFIHIDMRPPKANGGGYRWGSWARKAR